MSCAAPIRIKFITRGHNGRRWARQLPPSGSFSGQCSFHFMHDEPDYDWLVVIDDVSRELQTPPEALQCADDHTLLVTTEPPTITTYGKAFSTQFAHVLTTHPEDRLPHPRRIFSHTGNMWFNGHRYTELHGRNLPEKTMSLSTVCSSKQQKHTIHNDRYQFCHWLMEKIPTMNLFGHGSKFIENKYDALDPYRYHLAIENYSGPHHWTEKLADPFLSGCFPIYYGCNNVSDYFPSESFLEIDIYKRDEALDKIKAIINDDHHYASRMDALIEARKRVMGEHNLLSMVESLVLKHYNSSTKPSGRRLYGRKQMRLRSPADTIRLASWHIKRRFQ